MSAKSLKIEVDGRQYTAAELGEVVAPAPVISPPSREGDMPSFTPTEGQARAFDAVSGMMAKSGPQLLTIVGYAGTGKTTMLRLLAHEYGRPLAVTPTGKAALRVQEASGLPACTIHRWLYQPSTDPKTGKAQFAKKKDLEIPSCRLVLIDEASMVSAELWAAIWNEAKRFDLKIVAVGDGFQLPPVQDRNAPPFSLLDPAIIAAHAGARAELTEVLRQAQDSAVVRASMKLREGTGQALIELVQVPPEQLGEVCLGTFREGGVIITYTNATRAAVNAAMREAYGFLEGPQNGEPLLVLRNNYDLNVYNGEQVHFDRWVAEPTEPTKVRDRYTGAEAMIRYGIAAIDGQHAVLASEELGGKLGDVGTLAVATGAEHWARLHGHWTGDRPTPFLSANWGYAYTAHKSQGSEWPYAMVFVEPGIKLGTLDGRKWTYTAITRAKKAAAIYYGRL